MNSAFPTRPRSRNLCRPHHQTSQEQHWWNSGNNNDASVDRSATSGSWNCIDADTHSGLLARKSASCAKPYAVGFGWVSFRSANWLRDAEVTFASSMITYASVGMKDAITQRFCFVKYGNAGTAAPAKWSPITRRLGERGRDRSHRKGRNSTASHRSMPPSWHADQRNVFQNNNGPCLSRSQ